MPGLLSQMSFFSLVLTQYASVVVTSQMERVLLHQEHLRVAAILDSTFQPALRHAQGYAKTVEAATQSRVNASASESFLVHCVNSLPVQATMQPLDGQIAGDTVGAMPRRLIHVSVAIIGEVSIA